MDYFRFDYCFYLGYSAFWPAHIIYKSKSIKAIGRYINSNHKRPIFGYSYALANGTDQDVEIALKRIMNTYSEEDMHDIYGANLAILHNDSQALLQHAEKIKSDDHRNYFKAYAYILKGKFHGFHRVFREGANAVDDSFIKSG